MYLSPSRMILAWWREIDLWLRTMSFSGVRPITRDGRSSENSVPARPVLTATSRAGGAPSPRPCSASVRTGMVGAASRVASGAGAWAVAPGRMGVTEGTGAAAGGCSGSGAVGASEGEALPAVAPPDCRLTGPGSGAVPPAAPGAP